MSSNSPSILPVPERDPVCGMNVNPATAKHVHQHAGKNFYFCCASCLEKFKSQPDKFLSAPTRFVFFTGKGGVGKTSLSTATAIALADAGRRVLLVSTDAASNLDEMLGVPLRNQPVPVPGAPSSCPGCPSRRWGFRRWAR